MNHQDIDAIVEIIVERLKREPDNGGGMPLPMAGESRCITCPSNASGKEHGCSGLATTYGADRIGICAKPGERPKELRQYIDHTLLKPEATKDEIVTICEEAKKYGFASVCVNPAWVRLASGLLSGTRVKTVAVVGFPLGATSPFAKAFEAREAVRSGADEIDMVINIGALKSKAYDIVLADIAKVVNGAAPKPVKVIIETSKLSEFEKVIACSLSKIAGAAFVKTSTGFGGGGATAADVALMKTIVGDELEVKASGGIRDAKIAKEMIDAGATRLGASASVAIVTGQKSSSSY